MTRISGDWLSNPHTQAVCAMLTEAGYQALFVGGCVRNALFGVDVNDIDISTDAVPETVVDLAKRSGFYAVPTGIEHGTVTVIANHVPHEITTFRKDVETDGRRAVVAFAEQADEDAHRRDFTMNALYARPDGTIVDPLGGMDDLKARRVRFIDDANMRIREDYLRILRYFRFHAWYGDLALGMDPEALAAIADNAEGIETLSHERLGAEMLKLLSAPNPALSVAAMRASGALTKVIAGADDRALAPLVHLEEQSGAAIDPIRRLAVLGGADVAQALRLSKKQSRLLRVFREETGGTGSPAALAYFHGAGTALSIVLLKAALLEQPVMPGAQEEIERGGVAEFPVTPADLMPRLSGPALGHELKRLEGLWVESGFALTRDALLSPIQ